MSAVPVWKKKIQLMSTCILLPVAFRVVLATKVSIAFSSIGNCLVMQELIEWLVSSMCGNLQHQTSLNLDYVIAKNVLATKYKVMYIVLDVQEWWVWARAKQEMFWHLTSYMMKILMDLLIDAVGLECSTETYC
jgi:hypothetical protein